MGMFDWLITPKKRRNQGFAQAQNRYAFGLLITRVECGAKDMG
jgi:hypothetical protein